MSHGSAAAQSSPCPQRSFPHSWNITAGRMGLGDEEVVWGLEANRTFKQKSWAPSMTISHCNRQWT